MLQSRVSLLGENISYIFLVTQCLKVLGVDCLERKSEVRQVYFICLIFLIFYMPEFHRAELVSEWVGFTAKRLRRFECFRCSG